MPATKREPGQWFTRAGRKHRPRASGLHGLRPEAYASVTFFEQTTIHFRERRSQLTPPGPVPGPGGGGGGGPSNIAILRRLAAAFRRGVFFGAGFLRADFFEAGFLRADFFFGAGFLRVDLFPAPDFLRAPFFAVRPRPPFFAAMRSSRVKV